MIKYLAIIFIILLIKCSLGQTQIVSTNDIKASQFYDTNNHSIVISFTIEKSLNDTFDFYRFILRSIENLSPSSHSTIILLTNFTKLMDLSNSLRMFNLDTGQYEICIEFRNNISKFIYQPRDGCTSVQIGRSFEGSFKQSSTPLLIALASGIIIFFILGLVVQWIKTKRIKNNQDKTSQTHLPHMLSTKSFIRNLFHRHMDQPHSSSLRQWARNRAFRHRIATQEHDFVRRKLSQCLPQSRSHLSLLETQHPPKHVCFHLSPYEEHEMT